ncbi:MAG: cytochrome c [Xanthobacteraceae bacterium]|nr:cytochrome c [Xanthobacteraceae bacterium]
MRQIIATMAAIALLGLLGGAAFVYTGVYDVGADEKHWGITYRLIEKVRMQSIRAHAADIHAPGSLDDQDRVLAGAVHFATHCAICHSAPGAEAEDLAKGMYPEPPALTDAARDWKPRELFWIVKHGIKMSGMPSWADHGDDQLWNSVAFLKKLPTLTAEDYNRLVAAAKAKGIGHQMNDMPMNGGDQGTKTTPNAGAEGLGHQH